MRVRAVVPLLVVVSLSLVVGAAETGASDRYTVGVGDVLRVDGFQNDEISGDFTVEEEGWIVFPLLGEVPVVGRSTGDVAKILEEALERDFYVDVQVQVEVAEYRSRPVTVLGEVQKPGTYYLRGRTPLTQIIAEAGGLRPTAGASLELRRIEVFDGREVQNVFNFATDKLLRGEEGQGVELQAGDVVSVPSRQLYFITGEVARPGQYEISQGMTLMQALSQAGGQGKFASQQVELHRERDGDKEILEFDIAEIRKGRVPDPSIGPGDVIIVRRRFF